MLSQFQLIKLLFFIVILIINFYENVNLLAMLDIKKLKLKKIGYNDLRWVPIAAAAWVLKYRKTLYDR